MKHDDQTRVDRALEGRLTEAERVRFEADILADAELRAAYAERAWMHGQLLAERDRLPALLETPPAEPLSRERWQTVSWAAAAALVTMLATWFLVRPGNSGGVLIAEIVEADGCRWEGSDLPTAEGARVGPGTLVLAEGMASLRFASGAVLTLEAPSTLEIFTAMHCRLMEGSLVADVPPSAHGFRVETRDVNVIDHGTRFGVTTSGLGTSHVLVFDGEVAVEKPSGGEKRLGTGDVFVHGEDLRDASEEVARTVSPAPAPELGWRVLTTADGRGKDAFVRKGDSHGPVGGLPLLMVKHTDLVETNRRRAYLTFDLASVAGEAIDEAELVLDVEPSGLGFSALVPDSRFTVYGLPGNAWDEWDEASLVWETAPAVAGDRLDRSVAQRLAMFDIPRGGGSSFVRAGSETLARFLSEEAGSDGLATLVIVRETGEFEHQGLVHAFASREHASARPPTLRVRSEEKVSKTP